jgi:aspartate-semialdehyde dehydrogenase
MKGGISRTAILGASGYIGQHFARLLARHPWFGPPRLIGTGRSAGKSLAELWQLTEEPPRELARERLETTSPRRLASEGVRVVFSALPTDVAGPVESECVRRGISVFSNAADHRMDPRVPLLIPEVNPSHLDLNPRSGHRALLVTNPNCSATGLVVAIAPLRNLLRPRTVHVATYQAISGAGFPGVASLTIADNVLPFIPDEEEKMAEESARILGRVQGRRIVPATERFLAHCARVGVRDGHLEAVTIEGSRRPTEAGIREAWRRWDPLAGRGLPSAPHPPVIVRDEVDRPQPVRDRWAGSPDTARGMAVVVGRIRWTPPFLRFFLLSHNAIRGGAGGSVLNAEFAAVEGRLPRFGPMGRSD